MLSNDCYNIPLRDTIVLKDIAKVLWIPVSEGGITSYEGELDLDPNGEKTFAPFWKFSTSFTNQFNSTTKINLIYSQSEKGALKWATFEQDIASTVKAQVTKDLKLKEGGPYTDADIRIPQIDRDLARGLCQEMFIEIPIHALTSGDENLSIENIISSLIEQIPFAK